MMSRYEHVPVWIFVLGRVLFQLISLREDLVTVGKCASVSLNIRQSMSDEGDGRRTLGMIYR